MAISLSKGQSFDLSKTAPGLSKVVMGLGWDAAKPKGIFGALFGGGSGEIDLDASCLMFDAGKRLVDVVWFQRLESATGAVRHTGDNLTGDGEGDDERIIVDLAALPPGVTALVFTVNSFRGQTFEEVDNAFCRLADATAGERELCRFTLSEKGRHTGVVMAVVSVSNGAWSMKAVGVPANGRTVKDMEGEAARYV